jgi:hypothetical protein
VKIAIDVQHLGKPHAPADRGAVGRVEEAYLSTLYGLALDRELRRLGHEVLWLGCGTYPERWAIADGWGARVYLALHCNAGARGADRGLLLHDHRSQAGRMLATACAAELVRRLPWPVTVSGCRPDTNGSPRDGDYSEAYACIAGVRAVALCVEPLMLDGAQVLARSEGAALLDLAHIVGSGLALGVHQWAG